MTRYEQGDFQDLDVTHDRTIQGSVAGTVTVSPRCHLLVQGAFRGVLHVGADGMVTIQGAAHGRVEANEGLIVVAGETDWVFSETPGLVAVANGTVLTAEGSGIVRSDGSVETLAGQDRKIDMHLDRIENYCAYNREEQRFIPMADLPSRGEGVQSQ